MSMQEQGSNPKGISVAIIVILLLAAGFFLYNKNNASRTALAPLPSPIESTQPEVSPSSEASASPKVGEEMTVTLLEQNNSKQAGVATLQEIGDKTRVQLRVAGATAGAQPAHIHVGKCPKPGAVKYPLTDLVNGISETMLDVSLSSLKQALPLAINIHKSKAEVALYTACGDLQ